MRKFCQKVDTALQQELLLQRKPYHNPPESAIFASAACSTSTLKPSRQHKDTRISPLPFSDSVIEHALDFATPNTETDGSDLDIPAHNRVIVPLHSLEDVDHAQLEVPLHSSKDETPQVNLDSAQSDAPEILLLQKPILDRTTITPPKKTVCRTSLSRLTKIAKETGRVDVFQNAANNLREVTTSSTHTTVQASDKPITLHRGISVLVRLGSLSRTVRIHTPRIHFRLIQDLPNDTSARRMASSGASPVQQILSQPREVLLRWLPEDEVAALSSAPYPVRIAGLQDLPIGADSMLQFMDIGWPKVFCMQYGPEVVYVQYSSFVGALERD